MPDLAVSTALADASPTRDPFVVPGKETQATVIAENFARSLTATALTPEPTLPPLVFSEPTPTWALGMVDCGLPGNPYEPQLNTCWRGMVAGNLTAVAAGHEGEMGDRAQGILVVSDGPDIYVPHFPCIARPRWPARFVSLPFRACKSSSRPPTRKRPSYLIWRPVCWSYSALCLRLQFNSSTPRNFQQLRRSLLTPTRPSRIVITNSVCRD